MRVFHSTLLIETGRYLPRWARAGKGFRAGVHMLHSKAWRIACAVAFGLFGAAFPSVGSAEYRLAPGDVIEVAVASVPDLRQRARVDSEGEVSLAYLGAN